LIRCVAYCRVSTNSKDQENSLENQISYFNREIEKNSDYRLINIYADRGISGAKLKRPQFNQMLYDAGLDIIEVLNNDKDNRLTAKKYITVPSTSRKPMFDLILVKNTSRFARNILVEDILRDLKRNKVFVYFLDLNKTTENNDDIAYIQIFQTFDEQESREKSKKVKFGIKEGAKKGVIHTNSKLYGYKYIQKENRLEIIHDEAEVIRIIFQMYSDDKGIRKISKFLAESNYKTRKNKNFTNSTIQRILTNHKYAGLNVRLKYDTGTVLDKYSYSKIRNEKEWIVNNSDKIPPIISKDKFNYCQKLLKEKADNNKRRGINKSSYLAGLLYCGKCGGNYYSNMDRGKRFFVCKIKKLQGADTCDNRNISEETLLSLLKSENYIKLKQQAIEAALKKLNEQLIDKNMRLENPDFNRINKLEEKLKIIDIQSQRLINAPYFFRQSYRFRQER